MNKFAKPVVILGKACDQTPVELIRERAALFEQADLILAPEAVLAALPPAFAAKARPLDARPDKLAELLGMEIAWGKKVLIVANGDPMFYGIGSSLARRLDPAVLGVVPAVGCVQTLTARILDPGEGSLSLSLHGRSSLRPLTDALKTRRPLRILTDRVNSPDAVARFLLDRGVVAYDCVIGENLGAEDERVSRASLAECAAGKYAPNSVLFLNPAREERRPIPRGRTRSLVAAAIIDLLDPGPDDIFWDIGAGTGSVAFRGAALSGEVFAIEKNPRRAMEIQLNRRALGAANVVAVLGSAPACLARLPRPDKIFVGGGLSAPDGAEILRACLPYLAAGARLAASCVLLESLNKIQAFAEREGLTINVCRITESVLTPLGYGSCFKPKNPVYLAVCAKA